MSSSPFLNPLRAAALVLLGAVFPAVAPVHGKGDDTYRFAPGPIAPQSLKLEATPDGVRWHWARPGAAPWDTALLGLRLHAVDGYKGESWVEFSTGSLRVRQYLEANAQGLRWLNFSGLQAQLTEGRAVEIHGHGVAIEPGAATLRVFANTLGAKARILVLAPHPDDAEIAAFGLYAHRNATIVTITCGNAGDANYKEHFTDTAEQYRFKGFLRAVDSVTVPWLGGIRPEHCFNLGYFDGRLQEMHAKPGEVFPETYGPNKDVSGYRRVNLGNLLSRGPRTNSWAHLVEDLAEVIRKVKPTLIVTPHPFLDGHSDHDFTTVAAMEALARWKRPVTLLLYTNHADDNLYQYGPAGTSAPLPPWSGRELPVEGVYAHPVSPELQRLKLFALDNMHDLRLSPAEQAECMEGGVKTHREDYPRILSVDYFRRAPRPEELFFVFSREGAEELIRTFVAEVKD